MKLLFAAGTVLAPASWLLAQAADPSTPDVSGFLKAYGIAAPFAGLCLWLLLRLWRANDKLSQQIGALQQAAVDREKEYAKDLLTKIAPILHDGAQLYRLGNDAMSRRLAAMTSAGGEPELHSLVAGVEELLRRLKETDGGT